MTRITNTQQKVDQEKYAANFDKIFRKTGYCIHGKKITETCHFCKPPVDDNPYRKYWDAAS